MLMNLQGESPLRRSHDEITENSTSDSETGRLCRQSLGPGWQQTSLHPNNWERMSAARVAQLSR